MVSVLVVLHPCTSNYYHFLFHNSLLCSFSTFCIDPAYLYCALLSSALSIDAVEDPGWRRGETLFSVALLSWGDYYWPHCSEELNIWEYGDVVSKAAKGRVDVKEKGLGSGKCQLIQLEP